MPAEISEYLVLLLAGWCSGISVYLTIALLGISQRCGWIQLPGDLQNFSNIFIIALAIAVYVVEFFADKIPYVDSAWDSVHTFIRPAGAAVMGYLAGSHIGPVAQTAFAIITGTITLNMHAVKSATRLAINTSPEPFSNIGASLAEHSSVFFFFWFFIKHPILACAVMVAILIASFFFLRMMWRFVKRLFKKVDQKTTPVVSVPSGQPER